MKVKSLLTVFILTTELIKLTLTVKLRGTASLFDIKDKKYSIKFLSMYALSIKKAFNKKGINPFTFNDPSPSNWELLGEEYLSKLRLEKG